MANALLGNAAPFVIGGLNTNGANTAPDPLPNQNRDQHLTGPNPQYTPIIATYGNPATVEPDGTMIARPTQSGTSILGEDE
jgi:hypothetical protein